MKNIKSYKIFEGKDTFKDDCESVFMELIDEGADVVETTDNEMFVYIPFGLNEGETFSDMEDFTDYYNKTFEVINDIKSALGRLADMWDITFQIEQGQNEFNIYIVKLDNAIKGDFWILNGDKFLIINRKKLKDHLNLPKNVDAWESTDGRNSMIVFGFKNSDDLDKYSEKLIEDFEKLEINGVKLSGPFTLYHSTSEGEVKNSHRIDREEKQTSYGGGSERTETVNQITFGTNKFFDVRL